MKVAVISDVHGNLEALSEVVKRIDNCEKIVLLGDNIDYCPHSNEVVSIISSLSNRIICSIWGNHERMILEDDYSGFELDRGVRCAKFTKSILSDDAIKYLKEKVSADGISELIIGSKRCLAVHGSLDDPFWGTVEPATGLESYSGYDYVFSGHSHIPHLFENYYPADDPKRRNKKKTIFINPGSVGQPRNHSPLSQFAILDTESEEISFMKVQYDIRKEQSAFSDEVDVFYRTRLTYGV